MVSRVIVVKLPGEIILCVKIFSARCDFLEMSGDRYVLRKMNNFDKKKNCALLTEISNREECSSSIIKRVTETLVKRKVKRTFERNVVLSG